MIPISSFTPVVGPGQYLSRASGLAIDSAGNFYMTDRQMHKVHVFSRAGVWLRCWGGPGSGDGLFNQPRGIFVDQYDNVYVADCLNGRIQKFTSSGTFLLKFGSSTPGDSYLSSPYCVMVDLNDDVFVADFYGAAVKVFSNQGVYKDRVGTSGWRPGSTERPSGVYSDSMGTVHIADYSLAWIAQFRWALAPISDFTALPLTGLPPLSVQFTDTSQNYPTSWLWSFGDGEMSTLKNPLHEYLDEGLYSVGLKVTNTIGDNTTIKTDYILVEVPVPETPRFKPLWSLQIGPV
jgi:PKD repeat protein